MRTLRFGITHDPYAPNMASKYGSPGNTDSEGFDPYADSVGAGIYSGTVRRRPGDGSVVIGEQYQNHNPRPGPVYSGGGYTPVSRAIAAFKAEAGRSGGAAATTLAKLLDAHPDLVNDGARRRFPSRPRPSTQFSLLAISHSIIKLLPSLCVSVCVRRSQHSVALMHHTHLPPGLVEQWPPAARYPCTRAA